METLVICFVPEPKQYFQGLMETYSDKVNSKKALIFPPHVTIVSRFKTESYQELLCSIKEKTKEISSFDLKFKSIKFFEDPKVIVGEFEKDDKLQKVHEIFLDLVLKFKTDWKRDTLKDLDVSNDQKQLIQKYGSPFVMQYYNPHLSLTARDCQEELFENVVKDLPLNVNKVVSFNAISIMKRDGDSWFIDKTFPLN